MLSRSAFETGTRAATGSPLTVKATGPFCASPTYPASDPVAFRSSRVFTARSPSFRSGPRSGLDSHGENHDETLRFTDDVEVYAEVPETQLPRRERIRAHPLAAPRLDDRIHGEIAVHAIENDRLLPRGQGFEMRNGCRRVFDPKVMLLSVPRSLVAGNTRLTSAPPSSSG